MNGRSARISPRSIVTGGAGFLGSHLVDELIARNHEVVVVDDLSTGHVGNLADALESGSATFVYGDVTTVGATLAGSLAEMQAPRLDYVFHLASPASPEAYGAHPWETLRANAIGTMDFIDLALRHNATFIYASTSEVYGDPLVNPQPEDYFGNVDPIGPRSCYDEGKRFGEAAVAAAVGARGLSARIVRFFNCYGPRMERGDGRLIPALIDAAVAGAPFPIHGSGEQTRSMTFVSDAVAGILTVLAATRDWRPFNVGSEDERSVLDIAHAVAEAMKVPFFAERVSPRPGDPQRRRPDLTAIRALGWAPRVALADGLAQTSAWFAGHREVFA